MSLSVVGAGLGRTGTASLKIALEQLLGGRCYHMSECFGNPQNPPLWLAASRGKPDWAKIFAGYVATVDYPGCAFWRELAAAYPRAKVLLTVRNPDKWFESTRETIFSDELRALIEQAPEKEFFHAAVYKDFVGRFEDRAFMTAYFERHSDEVKRSIPKGRLLVYEVGEGWAPLCEFLGVPVPVTPFPHVNVRDDFRQMIRGMQQAMSAGATGGLAEVRKQVQAIHKPA